MFTPSGGVTRPRIVCFSAAFTFRAKFDTTTLLGSSLMSSMSTEVVELLASADVAVTVKR